MLEVEGAVVGGNGLVGYDDEFGVCFYVVGIVGLVGGQHRLRHLLHSIGQTAGEEQFYLVLGFVEDFLQPPQVVLDFLMRSIQPILEQADDFVFFFVALVKFIQATLVEVLLLHQHSDDLDDVFPFDLGLFLEGDPNFLLVTKFPQNFTH